MIVVDTSAIIAILKHEPEAERFARAIADADRRLVSAVSYLEASLVMVGRGPADAAADVDALLHGAALEIVPFDEEAAAASRVAFARFGKGRHPAALNLGDCAAYALARFHGAPLLFKGEDFARTDIARVAI